MAKEKTICENCFREITDWRNQIRDGYTVCCNELPFDVPANDSRLAELLNPETIGKRRYELGAALRKDYI